MTPLYKITALQPVEITCVRLLPFGGPGIMDGGVRAGQAEPLEFAEETLRLTPKDKPLIHVSEIINVLHSETRATLTLPVPLPSDVESPLPGGEWIRVERTQ
jgi:hypothetical protein